MGNGKGQCTLAVLQGDYIFTENGHQRDKGAYVPFAYAEMESYDDAGKMTGVFGPLCGIFYAQHVTNHEDAADVFIDIELQQCINFQLQNKQNCYS